MFERTIGLIGKENFEKIQNTKVLLIGVGGVGSSALEGLVRSGFKNITIIDFDTIDESNLNRQLITNSKNVGNKKVLEASKRAKDINPSISLETRETLLTEDKINELLDNNYDYIIDACDDVKVKFALIEKNLKHESKLITCLGTAKKLDPTKLEITTIDKTYNDPLAKILRKKVKDSHINPKKVKVVTSTEVPIECNGLASMCMVPNTAGLLCVSYIVKELLTK